MSKSNTMSQLQRPRPKHTQLPPLFTRFSTAPPQLQHTIIVPTRQRHSLPPPLRELPTPLRIARPVSCNVPRELPTPLRIARPTSYNVPRTRQPEETQSRPRSKYIPTEGPTGGYVPFGRAPKLEKGEVDEITALVQASIDDISLGKADEIEVLHASPDGNYLTTPLCVPGVKPLTLPTPSVSTSIQSTPIHTPPTPSSSSLFSQVRRSLTFSDDVWADFDEEKESEEYTDKFEDVLEEYHDRRLGRAWIGTIRR
ncbi:hypothetical protein BDD12DRAFT_18888 [Trichophaea hybrida]|nr:hypothetical protein BDD12DRAFT_18888 [Trichophaea hybrida]